MRTTRGLYIGMVALGIAMLLTAAPARLHAQQSTDPAIRIGDNDLGGVVTSANGPEAGVWVIAETTDLPTKFAKIVVTDERGRYVMPDLPKANYSVWVRGYGLVDAPKVQSAPGKTLNLTAVPAPNEAGGGSSTIRPSTGIRCSRSRMPASSAARATFPPNVTQSDWLTVVKNRSCIGCHQLGQLSTRTIPAALGEFKSSDEAWLRRVQSGQAANSMVNPLTQQLGGAPFKYFGDWTDRIARGELPHASRRGHKASNATSWSRRGSGGTRRNTSTT